MVENRVSGWIFDLQRCSLNDGPGIRTTVFLKGCPLRCQWCHNPESQRHGVETDSDGKTWGKEMTVSAIMATVEQDRAFYEASGGGITLSGGEPLAQPEFTLALLGAAREAGIHTCLDTSGHAPEEIFPETLPLTDVYHFDYKATGSALHRELTGVDGSRIQRNLETLLSNPSNVILRCPVIPTANDQPEHFKAIAALAQNHPRLRVEILPYHAMGADKAARLQVPCPPFPKVEAQHMENWRSALEAAGCPPEQLYFHSS